jgi:short-subunit dehydrogenase
MSKFTCTTALITGAAFARQLAKPGCSQILVERRPERLQSLAGELEKPGAHVEPLVYKLYGLTKAEIKIVEGK